MGRGIRSYLVGLAVAGLISFVFSASSCGKKEEKVEEIPPKSEIMVHQEGGEVMIHPNDTMNSLLGQGKYDQIKKELCGDNGCLDELGKGDLGLSGAVVVLNTLILIKRIDNAVSTLCGLTNIEGLCAPPVKKADLRISPHQNNVIDTVLNLVGLKRTEINQITDEVLKAVENINAKDDKGEVKGKSYVFVLTSVNVKVGNAVNVWLKKDTKVRYDHFMILGAVFQALKALFNVIDAHNWELDISGVLGNASQLLSDLNNDPAGFIRRLPYTLGIDKQPNFLRFVSGGADKWKQVPTNISNLLYWLGDGLEFASADKNLCDKYKDALLCWDKNNNQLVFNLEIRKESIFLEKKGEEVDGKLKLPGGFSEIQISDVISVIRNGGDKFNCSKDDNWINVAEAGKFDIKKLVDAVASVFLGQLTEIVPEDLNFAKLNFCMLFGVEDAQPKSIRDLLLPAEIKKEDDKYKIANAGPYFAIEVEATKNFYARVITEGNTSANPIYLDDITKSLGVSIADISLVVNVTNVIPPELSFLIPFAPTVIPYQPGTYASGATRVYVQSSTILVFPSDITFIPAVFFPFAAPIIRGYPEITTLFETGITTNALALLVTPYVKGDYVFRGDGNRFGNIDGVSIRRDWADPATTFIAPFKWHSKYPADVFGGGLLDILNALGKTSLLYVLFRETGQNGEILNGAVQLDNCLVAWAFANSVSGVWQKAVTENNDIIQGIAEYILGTVIAPFLAERVMGYDVQDFINQIIGGVENPQFKSLPGDIIGKVKYLSGTDGACEIDVGNVKQTPQAYKFLTATNQIVNDLLGIGLLAIALGSAL